VDPIVSTNLACGDSACRVHAAIACLPHIGSRMTSIRPWAASLKLAVEASSSSNTTIFISPGGPGVLQALARPRGRNDVLSTHQPGCLYSEQASRTARAQNDDMFALFQSRTPL